MMQPERAIEIIRALADGVDPYTGEVFPPGSAYQQADTVRALYLAIEALERLEAWTKRQKSLPERAGQPWDAQEDQSLRESYAAGVSIGDLATKHQRTAGAIRSRLERLGIEAPAE